MATKIIMPKQGLQMTEGTIIKWLLKEGEKVAEGAPLFEIETDKLTITIDAPVSGTLLKITRQEGDIVPITEMIGVIGEPGEDISGLLTEITPGNPVVRQDEPAQPETAVLKSTATENPGSERVFITPRAKMLAREKTIDISQIRGTGPQGLIIEADVKGLASREIAAWKATPLAKKIAAQNELPLAGLASQGSGAGGKITRADVEKAIAARSNQHAANRDESVIPFAGMRKVIAERMMQSFHNGVPANHRMKVNMTEIINLREKLKANQVTVSFTDILVKIAAKALLDFPIINATLADKGIILKHYANIGIAVAIDKGLIVPVIKNADLMTLPEIAAVSGELIDQAKKGSLQPDDYTGGTFTITNLGMFDIDEFTAIINPPESAILAVGKIERTPIAQGDDIVIQPLMMLSLTYDHRVIDGAPAAQFLQRMKQIMQNPYLLL